MKLFAPTCLLLIVCFSLGAEAHVEPLRAITERSCTCIEKLDMSKLKNSEQRNMQLGLCVIKSAKGFEKYLKAEKNIDLERIGDSDHGTRLGYLFAVEAAGVCPETLAKFTGDTEGSFEGTVAGRVTEVSSTSYTRLTVEDAAGKPTTLYWLFNFENSNLVLKSLNEKNARFEFTYVEKEIFFYARKEYHKVKIITAAKKQ